MPARNIYLVTALPSMTEPGADPPMSPGDFLEHVEPAPRARSLAEAIFLGDDLLQREAVLAGEIDQAEPIVLTPAQLRDAEPLPGFLAGDDAAEAAEAGLATDALWAAYYRYAFDLADGRGLLAEWVAFEVGLRNALAAARAKALGIEADRYRVLPELGNDEEDYASVLGEWSVAADPLAALRVLDRARWTWLNEHDQWFTFDDDELAAYALRLLLVWRWRRLADAERAEAPRTQTA